MHKTEGMIDEKCIHPPLKKKIGTFFVLIMCTLHGCIIIDEQGQNKKPKCAKLVLTWIAKS